MKLAINKLKWFAVGSFKLFISKMRYLFQNRKKVVINLFKWFLYLIIQLMTLFVICYIFYVPGTEYVKYLITYDPDPNRISNSLYFVFVSGSMFTFVILWIHKKCKKIAEKREKDEIKK